MVTTESTCDSSGSAYAPASDDLRTAARRRLQRKREFTEHLTAYLVVNTVFVAVWAVIALTAGWWFPWPVFPIAFWGIGLVMHAWAVFGPASRPIGEDEVAREMQRLARS
jgi:hypothetical protein